MKKVLIITMAMVIIAASAAFAKPVYLAGEAWVDADPASNAVQFTWKFADHGDMWANNQVQFCPDPLREGCDPNVPFAAANAGGNVYQYSIPMEVIAGGQSALNLANDSNWLDALWLGLPDCSKLHLGKNLIYYRSILDPGIPKSGGMHILYIGPGAPFVPQAGDPRIYQCKVSPTTAITPTISVAEKPKKAVPQKKFKKRADGTICEEPCIQETLQNTREIKSDVKEVKESVGTPDKTDAADEKTVQQKARKTLKKVKHIKAQVGTSKSGRSLHDKVGEFKRKNGTVAGSLEEIHKDMKEIKSALKIPATPEDKKICLECHK